jgi:hypothetical protein
MFYKRFLECYCNITFTVITQKKEFYPVVKNLKFSSNLECCHVPACEFGVERMKGDAIH